MQKNAEQIEMAFGNGTPGDSENVVCDTSRDGGTENAGVENAIRSKLQGRKMREWK